MRACVRRAFRLVGEELKAARKIIHEALENRPAVAVPYPLSLTSL